MELPIIDFKNGAKLSSALLNELDAACRDHGFVLLKNSGIDDAVINEAFATAKELFALSDDEKSRMTQISPETNQGYSGLKKESLNHARGLDMKEAYNLKFNDNDLRGTPESFRSMAPKLIQAAREACRLYATTCALALGLEANHFAKCFQTMELSTIRFLHYPPVTDPALIGAVADHDESKQIRLGEHTDFGFFTHLYVEKSATNAGLQVKPEDGKTWRSVDASAAQCIVNTGALAARWTNDIWAATAHRVIVPDVETAKGHRYSMAIFFDPDPETLITTHPNFMQAGQSSKYPPISALDYLLFKLNQTQKPPASATTAAAAAAAA